MSNKKTKTKKDSKLYAALGFYTGSDRPSIIDIGVLQNVKEQAATLYGYGEYDAVSIHEVGAPVFKTKPRSKSDIFEPVEATA